MTEKRHLEVYQFLCKPSFVLPANYFERANCEVDLSLANHCLIAEDLDLRGMPVAGLAAPTRLGRTTSRSRGMSGGGPLRPLGGHLPTLEAPAARPTTGTGR
jgi:hypothetical protein